MSCHQQEAGRHAGLHAAQRRSAEAHLSIMREDMICVKRPACPVTYLGAIYIHKGASINKGPNMDPGIL